MKRVIYFIAALLICPVTLAQKTPVDEIFEKYSQKEGFTSVYISPKMLGLFGNLEAGSGGQENTGSIMLKLKSIQILSENDSLSNSGINFYTELSSKMDLSPYEELMVIREGKDITKFLIRQTGDRISELLMISGGSDGNVLISIKGDINLKEISELSKTIGVEQLQQLEGVEEKQKIK